jgi:hypothetical protein
MDVGAASLDDHLMQRMEQACALGVMEKELLEYILASLTSFSAVDKSDYTMRASMAPWPQLQQHLALLTSTRS